MYKGRNLMDLARELERQLDTKKDYVADTRKINMISGEEVALHGVGIMPVTQHFHGQMADKLNIPKKYYDRMLTKAPEILTANVNHWLQNEPKKVMVRTLDGNMRALLSDRYRTIDNYDVVQASLAPIVKAGCKIESCELTEKRVYIKATCPAIQAEVKKGDIVQAGVEIVNSEVGCGAVSIDPFILRLVCTNGMKARDYSLRKTHLGRRFDNGDSVNEFIRDETRMQDDKAFLMSISDIVTGLLDRVKFDVIVDKLRESTEKKIDADPVKVVGNMVKRFGMTDTENGNIMRHLIEGHDLSMYGLMNAVTRTSQDADNYDRATDLENIGGKIIDLTDSEWKALQA